VLPADTTMKLPGTVAIPSGAGAPWVPYAIRAGDALDAVAGRFDPVAGGSDPALDLAGANLNLPGTIAGGQTVAVTVQGTTYSTPTVADDSFGSVLERLRAQSVQLEALSLTEPSLDDVFLHETGRSLRDAGEPIAKEAA
jgi:hypothetical protein